MIISESLSEGMEVILTLCIGFKEYSVLLDFLVGENVSEEFMWQMRERFELIGFGSGGDFFPMILG